MNLIGSKQDSAYGNNGKWGLIYFLIGLTSATVFLSITQSQIIGTHVHWIALGLLFAFHLLTGRYWRSFLVLIAALATLSVYQAGIIIGYRSWYYIAILAALFLTLRHDAGYFRMPEFRWWFLLLLMGWIRLFFIESPEAFEYSRGAVLQTAAGLSAYVVAWQVFRQRGYGEAIFQVSFLVMSVSAISLVIPLYLTESGQTRIGVGIGMDANGLGITATYAFIAMLFHSMMGGKNRNLAVSGVIAVFLVVVLVRTGSRQAIVTNLLLLVLFMVITLRGRVKRRSLLIVGCILIGFSILVNTAEMRYLETRFNRAFGESGRIDRLDHLIVSLHMAKDNPLGLGGGGFKENFDHYKFKAGIESVHVRPNPHTLFGMVLADWGLPGLFLLLMGFYALARDVLRLRGLQLTVKALSLVSYFILANAGLVFPPVLMAFIGLRDPDEESVTSRIRIYWEA